MMLVYGDAFWPTYTTGDNTGLIATDSMKNFIQRETLNFAGSDLEDCCQFLAAKFLETYPQVEGVQVSAVEIPYAAIAGRKRCVCAGRARTRHRAHRMNRAGDCGSRFRHLRVSSCCGWAAARFMGFVRDQYTTLPDIENRPLHMWLDLEWMYTELQAGFSAGDRQRERCGSMVREVFHAFESGSIQQMIYQIGTKMLAEIPAIAEVHLEANNRTWDTVVERGEELGVYTDARPPYGCLGLEAAKR